MIFSKMTREVLEILTDAKIQAIIEENIECDPAKFALSQRNNDVPVAIIASQLHALQKSRTKLPSWFQARCILPTRAFEQASSETTAAMKTWSGERCLDLTTGLGVDSWHFSQNFRHVISLEQNPDLAAITTFNLHKMGVSNVHVTHAEAATYLRAYTGPPFDLIYLDPDRRDAAGQRKIRIEDCSPDVFKLLPLLRQHGKTILIKLSPLFDLTEARRAFPQANRMMVLSVNNECKELLVELTPEATNPRTEIRLSRKGIVYVYDFPAALAELPTETGSQVFDATFLLEPDAAFYKAGLGPALIQTYFPGLAGGFFRREGFFFSQTPAPEDFPGRCFRICKQMPYKPASLKKWLKQEGIRHINVVKRDFPASTVAIRKQLGIVEGGDGFLVCTSLPNRQLRAYCAERC